MKKFLLIALSSVLALGMLTACGETNQFEPENEPGTPPDLVGEWKQTNSDVENAWQAATITGDAIEVYWVSDNGDTKALYWAGSFDAPTTADSRTLGNQKMIKTRPIRQFSPAEMTPRRLPIRTA